MKKNNNNNETYNNKNIDIALSYVCDILNEESINISVIKEDIKKLEDRINYYNLLILDEEKNRSDSNYYFMTNDTKNSDLYKSDLYNEINKIKSELEVINNKYKKSEDRLLKMKYIENIFYQHKNENRIASNRNNEIGLQILETQELERSRIARDLHDSTTQALTSLIHKTELCTRLLDIDVIRAKLEFKSMTCSLRTIVNDMRDIIYNLKPMSLEDLGLKATVSKLLDNINKSRAIQTELIIKQEEADLTDIINLTLFRIIQEACNNVIKHAEADRIIIILDYGVDNIIVEINDNGQGFCIDNEDKTIKETGYGLGLSIMKERVLLLSGDIVIESKIGRGTKIIINIPINNLEEEDGYGDC